MDARTQAVFLRLDRRIIGIVACGVGLTLIPDPSPLKGEGSRKKKALRLPPAPIFPVAAATYLSEAQNFWMRVQASVRAASEVA